MKRSLFSLICILAGLFGLLLISGLAAQAQEGVEAENKIYLPYAVGEVRVKGVATCANGFLNSGFENDTGWEIPLTAYPAGYTTGEARTGTRSMRTGIINPLHNTYSYSDARQVVSLPSNASSITLRMFIYPRTSETPVASQADLPRTLQAQQGSLPEILEGQPFGAAPMAGDVQYVLILNHQGVWIDTLLWQRSNAGGWVEETFDLTAYRGQTIKIQFGTYNDGYGGITSMHVDDAFLEVCTTATTPAVTPSPTALVPPTATPTPLPTPTPAPGCFEGVANGGFETISSWELPVTEYSAGYSAGQVRTGLLAMRTGITNPLHNRYSYSAARQRVTIPSNATSAVLRFYVYPTSGEVSTMALPEELPETREGQLFSSEEVMAGDVQYAIILDSSQVWVGTMVWQRSNSQTWTQYQFDLKGYAGKTIYLHFGTYNDGLGGISSMFVDDVSLTICTPTPLPTPSPTPAPTLPPPGSCPNLLVNPGFESSLSWQIPVTRYTAGYSSQQALTGLRSMRTGIVNPLDNRYSYSDAFQMVSVPPNLSRLILRMNVLQFSGESNSIAIAQTMEGEVFGEAALAGDVQYLLILDRYGTWIDTLLWERKNTGQWWEIAWDLTSYRGWLLRLQFGTYNDGYGGVTSMYVDDMTLEACP